MNTSVIQEQHLDLVFQALANRTRRSLLNQLRESPRMVTELAKSYKMSLNAVSKHLLVLERAGLIKRDVIGRTHACYLQAGPLAAAEDWLHDYEQFWRGNLDSFATFVETKYSEEEND